VDAENSHLHSNIEQLNTQLASLQDERDRLRENWELSRAELEAAQQEVRPAEGAVDIVV
jgi:predicted  nucleic acid-binding Zn-ribbon protein